MLHCPLMESIFSNVLMFVLGLVALSFLVTIHELGHFLVAKWNNVKVNTFSIGFGKKLIRYRRGETEYCRSLATPLPFMYRSASSYIALMSPLSAAFSKSLAASEGMGFSRPYPRR